MNLKSYMEDRAISGEKMAEVIGNVTGAAVLLWAKGARMPSPEIAERIVDITSGLVTVQDLHETRLAFLRSSSAAPAPAEPNQEVA